MDYRRLIGVVIIGTLLFSGLASCSAPTGGGGLTGVEYMAISLPVGESGGAVISKAESGGGEEFEAIRQAADTYVNSGKPLYISAQQLYNNIMTGVGLSDFQVIWYDPGYYTRAPLVLDVRTAQPEMPDLYLAGHIPGAVHIPWQQLTLYKYFKNLPKDRQIAVISSTGEIGAQITAILNVLGYDAVNLMWGMTSWTSNATVAPGGYVKARDTVSDWGLDYTSGSTAEPTETYPFPVVDNTESKDKAAIILAAANAYLTSGTKRFDMKSSDLYQALNFNPQTAAQLFLSTFFTGSATGNPYAVPFVLDIRDSASYNRGHLSGALHIYWKDVFKTDNLDKLPAGQPIVVYGDTGQESSAVAALLNLLGYDAENLRWGIAADQFVASRDCMNYPVVTGFDPFLPCPG